MLGLFLIGFCASGSLVGSELLRGNLLIFTGYCVCCMLILAAVLALLLQIECGQNAEDQPSKFIVMPLRGSLVLMAATAAVAMLFPGVMLWLADPELARIFR